MNFNIKALVFALAFGSLASAGTIETMSVKSKDISSGNMATTSIVETRYQSLMDHFERASRPQYSEIEGWWSGRCYNKSHEDKALPTLMVARTLEIQPEGAEGNGPLFPAPESKKIFNLVLVQSNYSSDPTFFDTLTPELTSEIEAFIATDYFKAIQAQPDPRANLIRSTNEANNTDYMVRKSGDYIFAKSVTIHDDADGSKAGDAWAACYFFKKLK